MFGELQTIASFEERVLRAADADLLARALQHPDFFYRHGAGTLFAECLGKIPLKKRNADLLCRFLIAAIQGRGIEGALDVLKAARAQGGNALVRKIMTGPHNDCILPFNYACLYHMSDSEPDSHKPDDDSHTIYRSLFTLAGQVGGKALQRRILRSENFWVFSSVALTKDDPVIFNDLLRMAYDAGGPRFRAQMFNSSGEYMDSAHAAFLSACGGHSRMIGAYLDLAGQIGGSALQRKVLRDANDNDTFFAGHTDYGSLIHAARSGDMKNVGALLDAMEIVGGNAMVRRAMTSNRFAYFHEACLHSDDGKMIGEILARVTETLGRGVTRRMIESRNYLAYRNAMQRWSKPAADALLGAATSRQRAAMRTIETPEWKTFCAGSVRGADQWQILGGGGLTRWRSVLNTVPPDRVSCHVSPYRFKPRLYDTLLPILRTVSHIELCGDASPDWAYRFSVLFSNAGEVDRYLSRYARQWNGGQSMSPVHDACLFDIPVKGLWNTHEWKNLTLKYGPSVTKYLGLAPEIERVAREKSLPFPRTAREVRALAAHVSYPRQDENPRLATAALECGVTGENFNKALDILKSRTKTRDYLPDITIDGAEIGHPHYYMTRLPPGDPLGLILGELTNCCQSVGGEGEKVAIHGTTSRNGGFYVWKKKTHGQITEHDKIIAQSWAWRGPRQQLVFDSFERLSPKFNKLVRPFLEHFAHAVAQDRETRRQIRGIHLGTGGQTPRSLPFPLVENPPVAPVVLWSQDSKKQYRVPAISHSPAATPA